MYRTWIIGLLCLFFASLPAIAQADGDDDLIPRQAIIQLAPGADLAAFNARHNTSVLQAIPTRHVYLLQLPATAPEEQLVLELEADPDTVWADLNYEGRAPEGRPQAFWGGATPNPAPYLGQWAAPLIGLDHAQRLSQGYGIVVAVVDTGIDPDHPMLAGRLLPGYNVLSNTIDTGDRGNGLDDDGDGFVDEMTGHGTHVAGIVALVAPAAQLLPVKVLDSDGNSESFTVAAGIFYAIDQGADVINLSLGSTYRSDLVEAAVKEARSHGIVVVASAGNVNANEIESPAREDEVIGVAATDPDDLKAPFSNHSERVVLSAPGVGISSTLPNDLYGSWSGTSMAAPFVAGGAALLLARYPDWTPFTVTKALTDTARPLDQLNPLYAGELGAGRVALGAALDYGLPACYQQGDINQDGQVTSTDLQLLADAWNSATYTPIADLNVDGHINLIDIMLATATWGQSCPAAFH